MDIFFELRVESCLITVKFISQVRILRLRAWQVRMQQNLAAPLCHSGSGVCLFAARRSKLGTSMTDWILIPS